MRVGLLGGTFDPPHMGHVHISESALKALELDSLWWLVTPQNPLKKKSPSSLAQRVEMSRALVQHPRILISDIEAALNTNKTIDTVCGLKHHFPKTSFVWVSGMDNAHSLHRWDRWKDLLNEISMLHLTRGPASLLVKKTPLRLLHTQKHVLIKKSGAYPLSPGITYWAMQNKILDISSTEIRKNKSKINDLG